MKKTFRIICIVLSVSVLTLLCACGVMDDAAFVSGSDLPGTAEENGSYMNPVFLPFPEYAGKVGDEIDALAAITQMIPELGGDENVELVIHDAVTNEEGTVFYTFEQAVGGLNVSFANAKLIVDKGGNVIGAGATLENRLVPAPETAWEITQEEAELIISDLAEPGERVLSNLTEQTVLPDPEINTGIYAWIVYTNNTDPEIDRPYMANYVNGTGEYLFSVPVTQPGDTDAMNGSTAIFAFEGLKKSEWTGKVTDSDGKVREITVPIMIDEASGLQYLGDPERRILCADSNDFRNNDTLTPVTSADGSWINNELITYEMFIRIWDFYNEHGWTGPDGVGTPSLLLMDLRDENGEPEDNAFYSGPAQGFQVFVFNDEFGDGSCSDIIGHEFTHCVTGSAQLTNMYMNDSGAINESISDIMGNLIEMSFGDSPGGEWIIGEKEKSGILRNMKDPHAYGQPEYTWDQYYVPNVLEATDENDNGGVHTNSGLLNLVSYKLGQAGMPLEDQFYFWLNVDLATSPTTDYPTLAVILPWCMEITGYSEYKDVLNKAIEEGKFTETGIPETAPEDGALLAFEIPGIDQLSDYEVLLSIVNPGDKKQYETWPVFATGWIVSVFDGGDYIVLLELKNKNDENDEFSAILTQNGWEYADRKAEEYADMALSGERDDLLIHFENGNVYEPETESLDELLFGS